MNLNSRLSVTLQPGSYTIEATTYMPATSGSFTLTIAGLVEAEKTTPEPEPEPEPDTCIGLLTATVRPKGVGTTTVCRTRRR